MHTTLDDVTMTMGAAGLAGGIAAGFGKTQQFRGRIAEGADNDEQLVIDETQYGQKMLESQEKLMLTVSSLLMTNYGNKMQSPSKVGDEHSNTNAFNVQEN